MTTKETLLPAVSFGESDIQEDVSGLDFAVNLDSASGSLVQYIKMVNSFKFLTKEEEHSLAVRSFNGDVVASEELVKSHLRLVVKIAMGYRRYGLVMMDLISEGNMGLLHAVSKFNPETGTRLVTYAVWWIRAAIKNFVLKSWSLVRIGTTNAEKNLFFGLGKIKEALRIPSDVTMTDAEIKKVAEYSNTTPRLVKRIEERLYASDVSMSQEYSDASGSLEDVIPSGEQSPQDIVLEKMERESLVNSIRFAFEKLSERERFIMHAKMMSGDKVTLQDLAKKFEISSERVRQILNSAMKKMKESMLIYNPNDERFA